MSLQDEPTRTRDGDPRAPGGQVWSLLRAEAVALASYATVMLSLMSWTTFTRDPHAYLLPTAAAGAVVTITGIAARAARLVRPLVVLLQIVLGTMAVSAAEVRNPVPLTASGRGHVVAVLDRAWNEASQFTPPMHVADGIGPYLVAGGAIAVLLADILATTLRRPSLAGLVALAVFSVPYSLVGHGVSWWVFALTAAAYLLLLRTTQMQRLARWGHHLDDESGPQLAQGAARRGVVAAGPAAIGVAATALAILVPVGVPSLHVDLSGLGAGHGNDNVTIHDPTAGMYDDLKDRSAKVLLTVKPLSGDVHRPPSYLRLAVLGDFDGRTWSTGPRKLPAENTGNTAFNPPMDDQTLLGQATTYRFQARQGFDSHWLPTFVYTTEIHASGEWRYDDSTHDFIAAGDTNLRGETWVATSAPVVPTQQRLRDAVQSPASTIPSEFLTLPDFTTPDADIRADERIIEHIAQQRTQKYDTPFEKAVALQEWFTSTGGFRYSLDRPAAADARTLAAFVTTNKVGYCQQFASAMAVMARQLNIPARVAVGFLGGERTDGGLWAFRGRDLHAWPELWFPGIGWVRFEPTPSDAHTVRPDYTVGALDPVAPQATVPGTQQAPGAIPQPSHGPRPSTTDAAHARHPRHHTSPAVVGLRIAGVALVLVAAGLTTPALLRRRRRRVRRGGGIEAAWAELGDTVVDLQVTWPPGRSPRESVVGAARVLAPDRASALALRRVVDAVERSRYAARPDVALPDVAQPEAAQPEAAQSAADDVRLVCAALRQEASPRVRRRALLWPASVFRRRPAPVAEGSAVRDRELVG